jgi:hypothetical protein
MTTGRRQNVDNDELIEAKIKECQRENGQCMISTSRRLRKQFGDKQVDTILRRLSARRYRGNKYQEKGINEISNLLKRLTNKKDNQEQYSL